MRERQGVQTLIPREAVSHHSQSPQTGPSPGTINRGFWHMCGSHMTTNLVKKKKKKGVAMETLAFHPECAKTHKNREHFLKEQTPGLSLLAF